MMSIGTVESTTVRWLKREPTVTIGSSSRTSRADCAEGAAGSGAVAGEAAGAAVCAWAARTAARTMRTASGRRAARAEKSPALEAAGKEKRELNIGWNRWFAPEGRRSIPVAWSTSRREGGREVRTGPVLNWTALPGGSRRKERELSETPAGTRSSTLSLSTLTSAKSHDDR